MLTDVDLTSRDATAIAGLVREGEVSAVEVVESYLRRIEELDGELGSFVHLDPERALERAQAVAAEPFAGVPFAVKDVVGFPGMRWAMGSRLFAMNAADEHSPYTQALERAGLVTLGKTATSELGLLGSTETLLEGRTRNPWASGVSAAGSSGGSAAAVAAGLLPMAHASDGGGSIRVPASVCGLFGFKPSNGRTEPTMPGGGGFNDLLVDHCVSRTVRDSALLLSLTERTDDAAPHSPVGFVRAGRPRPLRIALWRTTLLRNEPAAEMGAALDSAAALCAGLGHHVDEVTPPPVDGLALSEAFFIMAGAAVDNVASMVEPLLGREVGGDDFEPFTLELLDWYRSLSDVTQRAAPSVLAEAGSTYRAVFDEADVALTPTLAVEPWPLGHLAPTEGRAELITRTERAVGYTPIHNVAGCPAMSAPLHWSGAGLPVGVHFAAAPGADARLLELAYQLEAAKPWRDRRPPNEE